MLGTACVCVAGRNATDGDAQAVRWSRKRSERETLAKIAKTALQQAGAPRTGGVFLKSRKVNRRYQRLWWFFLK
jgi:hypothetical protein